jgi:nitronate monooxygenase
VRWGAGFITWMIPGVEANFQTCLDEHVPTLAFSFGDPTQYIARAKAAGAKVMCQVQSIESLRIALAAGVDVVVAQGNEAGGHTGQLGTLPFLAQALEIAGKTPVIASGGIGSGRALAAVLAAGAEGAWIGTPLLATHEAIEVADTYKKCIVESDGEDTVFTRVYDIMYDLRFPDGIAGRARINRFTREWHGRETEVRERREELAALVPFRPPLQRDPEVHPIWMGQSAGSVHGVRSVAEVIGELCDGAERLLRERSRIGFGRHTPFYELDFELRGCAGDVGCQPRRGGVGGICEDEQPPEPDDLAEDLDSFVLKLSHVVRDARQIAAGTGHAFHEARGNRIAHVGEHHRDL